VNLEISLGELLAAFALVHLVTSHPHFGDRGKVPVKTLVGAWAPLRSLLACRLCFGFWAGLAVAVATRSTGAAWRSGSIGAAAGLAVGMILLLASPKENEHLPTLPRGLGGLVAFVAAGVLVSSGLMGLWYLGWGEGWSMAFVRGLAASAFCYVLGLVCDVLEARLAEQGSFIEAIAPGKADPPGV